MWIPSSFIKAGLLVGVAASVATLPVQAADNYSLGICGVSQSDSGSEIRPTYAGDSYLVNYRSSDPRYQGFSFVGGNIKVKLTKAPVHGDVSPVDTPLGKSQGWYHYLPKHGYVGQDRFVMEVEKNGVKVRINYLMEVVAEDEPTTSIGDDGERHDVYCNPDSWKISSTVPSPDMLQSLQASLGSYSAIQVNTAKLTGGAIGQTTGATITLNTNAASYDLNSRASTTRCASRLV